MNDNSTFDISMDSFDVPKKTSRPSQKKTSAPKSPQRPSSSSGQRAPKTKETEKNWLENTKENVTSFRSRLAIGITLAIISLTMLIVLISFLKSGGVDQSIAANGTIEQIASAPEGVANAGGAFGAKLSHILFVDGLGIGSFILAFYLAYVALALFGVVKIKFWQFTFKCLFTAVALSIIIGLLTYNTESIVHWGGNHGHYVNQWLYHVSDVIGAYAVSIFLLGMLVVMYLHQIHSFYANASGTITKRREAMMDVIKSTKSNRGKIEEFPANDEVEETDEQKGSALHPLEQEPVAASASQQPAYGFSIDDEPKDEPVKVMGSVKKPLAPLSIDDEPAEQDDVVDNPFVIDEPVAKESNEVGFNIVARSTEEKEKDEADDAFSDITANDFKPYDIRDELSRYKFPTPELLKERPVKDGINIDEQNENKELIVRTLKSYDIEITRIEATIGPTVTRYEIVPSEGERIARIRRLEDDIARSLSALGIRIIAPIPGKDTIGIEVPNRDPQMVSMRSVVNSKKFRDTNMALPMALGVTITNDIFIADLVKMPHLLVAGGSGQGKSVGMHAIITSLIYKKHPGELKFVLIDPKQLEFSLYNKLDKHFLAKLPDEEDAIVTDPMKAVTTLSSICVEMDNRYTLLKTAGVRTIEEYNRKFSERRLNPEKGHKFMPYIVVIVDEFADLISTAGKDILLYISRIVAKARAAGIHMIIATQRPSTDVITGVIKSNFLGRIAFRVMQMVDSRTILDQPGANRLIGNGDMLFSHNSKMERVQCAFIETQEVESIVDFIDSQIGYPTPYILPEPERESGGAAPGAIDLSKRDELFDDCARFIVQNSTASTSSLQRRFGIGYNKAGKIMDQLEAAGIVGPADGQKPRAVLIDHIQLESILRDL